MTMIKSGRKEAIIAPTFGIQFKMKVKMPQKIARPTSSET
jgi:hypothetical protein